MACAKMTIVNEAKNYLGCKQGDAKHKKIVDTFNTISPLPDGAKMTYNAPWCACFVSAIAKMHTATDIIPCSYNVGTMVTKAKSMGIWVEDDSYTPNSGDLIIYDWQDSGIGNNIGSPDHVGIVEKVVSGVITVIEGNFSTMKTCARRTIKVNGKYIRGYITPKYKTDTSKKHYEKTMPKITNARGYYQMIDIAQPITDVQAFLNWAIDAKLATDGVYGVKTRNAVKDFQKKVGITSDGLFGKNTLAKCKEFTK